VSEREDLVARLRAGGCVFAEDEADVLLAAAADTEHDLAELVDRRLRGLPLEHVVGWADFCGVRVVVEPGVFVPRPRTELMVREATAIAERLPAPVTVLDLCCGCGAIGAVLAREVPGIVLHAADVDPAAVACARRNLAPLGAAVHQGDLFAALPAMLRGQIGVLTANVPYVPTGALGLMPAEARLYEPRAALDGGDDGLSVLRRVAAGAPRWLAPAGAVLMETSHQQATSASRALDEAGLTARIVHCDELDTAVVVGHRPA
jgi:release factor glutamine methyltransferase